MGTRHTDLDLRSRHLHAKAKPRVFVYEAGPCGSWLSRDLRRKKGDDGRGVAPSLLPQKAGARVKTDRRDAVPWARFRRSGDRTPVSVPPVDDAALRARCRAREDALGALQTAPFRPNALVLRHHLRDTGQATWGPAHRRWRSDGVCPTPAPQLVFQADGQAVTAHTERRRRLEHERHAPVQSWRLPPGGRGASGLARGVVDGGRHHGRGTGRLATRRAPQTAQDIPGAAPLGIGLRGTTPAGCDPHSGSYPGPPRPGGRGLGLPLSRPGQSPPATQAGKPPATDPSHQREGTRAAVQTLSPLEGSRHTRPPRRRGHSPCPERVPVGHGQPAPRAPVTPG